jgi:hypothetical protein
VCGGEERERERENEQLNPNNQHGNRCVRVCVRACIPVHIGIVFKVEPAGIVKRVDGTHVRFVCNIHHLCQCMSMVTIGGETSCLAVPRGFVI